MFSKEHAKESSGEYGKKKRVIFILYITTLFLLFRQTKTGKQKKEEKKISEN